MGAVGFVTRAPARSPMACAGRGRRPARARLRAVPRELRAPRAAPRRRTTASSPPPTHRMPRSGSGASPEAGERSLAPIAGITDQRVYAGFVGAADGLDRALATALIAPIRDRFPLERPQLQGGRLPDPDAPDEVIVNASAAARGDLQVGQRLHFRLIDPESSATTEADVEIVGIGTLPVEVVADETMVLGRLRVHACVLRRAPRLRRLRRQQRRPRTAASTLAATSHRRSARSGHQLQSARTQEQATVSDSLRPLVIVLVAIGLLAFGAAAVATGQVVHADARPVAHRQRPAPHARHGPRPDPHGRARDRGRWSPALAVATALVTMVLASPLAPDRPAARPRPRRRDSAIDVTVAAVGARGHRRDDPPAHRRVLVGEDARHCGRRCDDRPWLTALPGSPATVAGLTLALRDRRRARTRVACGRGDDRGRRRCWRCAPRSSPRPIALIDTPARLRLRRRSRRPEPVRGPGRVRARSRPSATATTWSRRPGSRPARSWSTAARCRASPPRP